MELHLQSICVPSEVLMINNLSQNMWSCSTSW